MKNKKSASALFNILLVAVFIFTLSFAGCKNFITNGAISSGETTNNADSSNNQDPTATSKEIKSLPTEAIDDETTSKKNDCYPEHSCLTGFVSKDAGFSIEYPSDSTEFCTNPYVSASGSPMLLSIEISPLNEIDSQQTNGYDKETSLKDQEALKDGKFGESIDFSYAPSEQVIKIGDTFGKDFMVLGRFNECDVLFERKLIFYNNGCRIILTLEMEKDEIIKSMPDFFGIDNENCGDALTWKRSGDENSQDDFYNALSSKTASIIAQDWYNTFDLIVNSLKMDTEYIYTNTRAVAFSNIRKRETNTENNYIIINSYPQFLKSGIIPEVTIKDLNAAIVNLIKPVEEQFIENVISMGPPDSSDPRDYVNTYEGDYSLVYSGEGLISMLYNLYTYTGGAHGGTWNLSLNYDPVKNNEINLGDVFKPEFDYVKFISDFCIKDLKNQMLAMEGMPDEAWIGEDAGPDKNNFSTFVLTGDGIIIKFAQYQVAPYAMGIFDVEIPYLSFKDNINLESPIEDFVK